MKLFKKLIMAVLVIVSLGGMAVGLSACGEDTSPKNPPKTYDLYLHEHYVWDENVPTKLLGLSEAGKEIAGSKRYITMSIPEGTTIIGEENAGSPGPFGEYDDSTEDADLWIKLTEEDQELFDWVIPTESLIKVTELSIPTSVTVLNDYAFYGFGLVTDLQLHEGITTLADSSLGEVCFETITVPSTVTEMGNCFYGCRRLKQINFADGFNMDYIPSQFALGTALETLTIPESVKTIKRSAFSICQNLTSVTLPSGLLSIESGAFDQCDLLKTITIPATVTSIAKNAFSLHVTEWDEDYSHITSEYDQVHFTSIVCETEALYNSIMQDSDGTNYKLNEAEKAVLTYVGKPQD